MQNDYDKDKTNVFVKYLPPDIDSEKLHELFASYGKIVSAKVMVNEETGQSLGYGYIFFYSFLFFYFFHFFPLPLFVLPPSLVSCEFGRWNRYLSFISSFFIMFFSCSRFFFFLCCPSFSYHNFITNCKEGEITPVLIYGIFPFPPFSFSLVVFSLGLHFSLACSLFPSPIASDLCIVL